MSMSVLGVKAERWEFALWDSLGSLAKYFAAGWLLNQIGIRWLERYWLLCSEINPDQI